MSIRLRACLLLVGLFTLTAGTAQADLGCDDARVYSKDLDQAELDFLLAFLPAFDQRPDAITVLETSAGPLYQLVTTCDDGDEWVSGTDLSAEAYQAFFDLHAADGYRPLLVEVYGDHPNETYVSVMVKDGTPARGRHRIDPDDWLDVRAELKALDYQPTWFSSSGSGANVRYACVWEDQGPDPTLQTMTGRSRDNFIDSEIESRRYGTRLVSASVHGTAEPPVFGGFFTTGLQPEWSVHPSLSSTQLDDLVEEKAAIGWEVDFVTAYEAAGRRYLAVFKRDPKRTFRVTGTDDSGFEAIDAAMEAHMRAGMISRASLAITDTQGRLVLARGYTYDGSDVADTAPTDVFRFASVSKPITAIATMALIEDDPGLSLDTPVAEVLDDWDWCASNSSCGLCLFAACDDPWWPDLTPRHLLSHHSGLNRWTSSGSLGDPMGNDRGVRDLLDAINGSASVTLPVTLDDIHTLMRAHGFDIPPGTEQDTDGDGAAEHFYSNYGYSLLGRYIEGATGLDYESYVRQRILDPLCITRMQIGTSEGDAKDEVRYEDSRHRMRRTVMEEDEDTWVPRVYGGFNLANYDAHGGWIGSTVDLAAILSALHDESDSPILTEASIDEMFSVPAHNTINNYGHGWLIGSSRKFHNGNIAGTHAAVQLWNDGSSYAVVFNRRTRDAFESGDSSRDDIRAGLNAAWSSISWPSVDHWNDHLCPPVEPADLDGNGVVDGVDLAIVLGGWGGVGEGDVNKDGAVDGLDLALVLGSWSP